MTDPLDAYVALLERLDRASLPELGQCLADDVRFADPFQAVNGRAAFLHVFDDLFEQVDELRFEVGARAWSAPLADGTRVAFLRWRLGGRLRALRGRGWTVEGVSELRFHPDGRLAAHLDFWDAAGGLYEHFPAIGPLLRWLRRRVAAR